ARRGRAARSTRLDEIGAALEDGLRLVSRHLVLPALGALDNVFRGLFGVALRSGGLKRNPRVVALLAQPNRYGETAVGFDFGDAQVVGGWGGSGRLAHVVELDVTDRADDSIDAGTLLELLAFGQAQERVFGGVGCITRNHEGLFTRDLDCQLGDLGRSHV